LRLITEGAPQSESVAGLSERLGVSARHLNRLFRTHLGASPIAVARAWRLQFAKQLIGDTDLPMFRVALASGFRSVRRFNDSIRELYGRTPSDLRRRRPVALRARTDEYVFRLAYHPPYDWESLLRFLAGRAVPGVEEVVAGAYRRTFSLQGRHGILQVRRGKTVHALEARIRFAEPLALLPIVTRLRAMFDLAADTAVIAEHFRRDLLLKRLVKKYPGLRVPGAWDGFELAVRALLGQQITVTAARGLAGRLVATYGKPLAGGGEGLSHVFPGAERLVDADLSTLGLTRARAAALGSLARAVVADPQIFGPRRSLEEAIVKLRALPGVGEWTAQYIAMREMREPDAFPAADIGLMRAMADRKGRRPTPGALLARAERWRPWRAYAAQHLWASQGMSYDRGEAPRDDRSPVRPLHPARPAARRLRADGDREARDAGAGRAARRGRARPGRARRRAGAARGRPR
jgi:AraC family transcriptional regulator of adaptative response / DNA-3-methyladenine glycosylase II